MRFLISQSLRELVHRVETMLDQNTIDHRVLQICYQVLEKTSHCLDNIYYTHILEPKLRQIKEQEQISRTILLTLYHIIKKGQTDPLSSSPARYNQDPF